MLWGTLYFKIYHIIVSNHKLFICLSRPTIQVLLINIYTFCTMCCLVISFLWKHRRMYFHKLRWLWCYEVTQSWGARVVSAVCNGLEPRQPVPEHVRITLCLSFHPKKRPFCTTLITNERHYKDLKTCSNGMYASMPLGITGRKIANTRYYKIKLSVTRKTVTFAVRRSSIAAYRGLHCFDSVNCPSLDPWHQKSRTWA